MIYNIYVLISLLLLYLYFKSNNQRSEYITFIFVGLWIIFAIEHYTTIDYGVYYEGFNFPTKGLWEPVYVWLITLFNPFGYVFFNACMAAFEIYTIYFMLKRFVQPQWQWLAILLIIIDPNVIFNFMTVKRQFIAMAVTMWIPYFLLTIPDKRRFIYSIITFIIAVNIHTAAYVALLYFALPFINVRPGKISCLIVCAIFFGCSGMLLSNTEMLFSIMKLTGMAGRYEQYFDILESSDMDDYGVGPVEAAVRIIVLFTLIWNSRFCSYTQYKFILLAIVGAFLNAILFSDIWRLAWFFTMFNFIAVPAAISVMWEKYHKSISIAIISLCLIMPLRQYYFVMTGQSSAHQMYKIKDYYTIFDDYVDKSTYSQDEM